MIFRKDNKKSASAFMEYAITLGIVSLALITMNTYIKRGLQGKVKEMTDYFIGREQVVEISPTATTDSNSRNLSDSTLNSEMFIGGSVRLGVSETANMAAASRVVDTAKTPYIPEFVPAEEGEVTLPVVPAEQTQAAESGRQAADRVILDSYIRNQ